MKNNSLIFHKKIALKQQVTSDFSAIAERCKLSKTLTKILLSRDVAEENFASFLKPSLKNDLPHPQDVKDLIPAAELIAKHVEKKSKIAICCDFDVDGLTGGSQLKAFLDLLGVESEVYVPDRFKDGYGLNSSMIEAAKKKNQKLLVTIDYGTTNHQELDLARSYGIETIVLDHHHVAEGEYPPSNFFINPQRSDCQFADGILCAAGLTWYLLIALRQVISDAKNIDLKDFLDLACLGTCCDMVPLKGVNRLIAKKGLEQLGVSKRPGIKALKQVVGVKNKVSSHHVGFGFGPRINAAGRMLHGSLIIELLTTNDQKRANQIANQLNKLNSERQDVELKIKNQAIREVEQEKSLPAGICIAGEKFHTGVIGIVAQRMVETFYRPAIVMGMDQGLYKGSVRGIKGFSVIDALSQLSNYFKKFGGHTGAGGFTLKADTDLEEFRAAFQKTCQKLFEEHQVDLVPTAICDTTSDFMEVDLDLCEELKTLAPFGIGNPAPVILLENLKVKDLKVLKNAHLKVTFTNGNSYLQGLYWNTVRHEALIPGQSVNVACKLEVNEFNCQKSVQLIIQAVESL